MEKDRKTKFMAIFAIFLAIIGISVGFAAFSTSLTIAGTGKVNASSWKIKFANLGAVAKTGTAVEVNAPTINTNDTNIGDYDVTFTTPGDSISYTFDVTNDGTFDAAITSLTIPTPNCTGTGTNASTDASNVCSNLEYTLKYADDTNVAVGNTLSASETKSLKLTLTYKASTTVEQLPTDNVSIDNLGITIIYSQD